MITRLEAARYRCFEQLGVDMSEFQAIVGVNGSGKTTLIDLLSLFGELTRADNIASVFTLKRGSLLARAVALRELRFTGRGDDFSLALEVKLPEGQRSASVNAMLANIKSKRPQDVQRNSADKWPSYLRYELRLFSSIFKRIASRVPVAACEDGEFRHLVAQLKPWVSAVVSA